MKKSAQFVLLWFYMMLFYIIGHIIGVLFIEGYSTRNYWGHLYFFDAVIMIGIMSSIQIFIFPITKRFREFIIPILVSIINIFILSDDPTGYGFEFVSGGIFLTSKFLVILEHLKRYITNDSFMAIYGMFIYRIGYSVYLLIIFYTFKYLLAKFTKFCEKKGYNNLLKNVQD
jgi:hypothetical protein